MAGTYLVDVQFAIGTNIEQTARGVVRTGTESVAIREELDGVDVGLVTRKGLHRLTGTNVPQFGKRIASTRDENVLVGRIDTDRHHIAEVVGELSDLGTGLNIPQHTSHVAGRGDDTAVIDETTAREITRVTGQLARNTCGTFTR